MINFEELTEICEEEREIIRTLIDEYLRYAIADREKLPRKVSNKLKRYEHVIRQMPKDWSNWLKAQVIVHAIFKKGGIAKKYSNMLQDCSSEEKKFFKQQLHRPWRFTFCRVVENLENQFFQMEDLISNEKFLIYSSSIQDIFEKSGSQTSYLMLVNFNEHCYQSYGIVNHFNGFHSEDLEFYAKQLGYPVDFPEDIYKIMDKDPIPFLMLYCGSNYPMIGARGKNMIHCSSLLHVREFDSENMEKFFEREQNPSGVLRLKHRDCGEFPNYAVGYYNPKKKHLVLQAETREGYTALVESLNQAAGKEVYSHTPEYAASFAMKMTAKDILRKEFLNDRYGKLFEKKEPSSPELERTNRFFELWKNAYNKGGKIELEKWANMVGISLKEAQELAEQLEEITDKMMGDNID